MMKDLIAGVFNIFEILQFLATYAKQSKSFKTVLKIKFNYNANSASVYILQNKIIAVILDPFKRFVTVLVLFLFLFFVVLELFIFFPLQSLIVCHILINLRLFFETRSFR